MDPIQQCGNMKLDRTRSHRIQRCDHARFYCTAGPIQTRLDAAAERDEVARDGAAAQDAI
jgi:hypothetical protein